MGTHLAHARWEDRLGGEIRGEFRTGARFPAKQNIAASRFISCFRTFDRISRTALCTVCLCVLMCLLHPLQ